MSNYKGKFHVSRPPPATACLELWIEIYLYIFTFWVVRKIKEFLRSSKLIRKCDSMKVGVPWSGLLQILAFMEYEGQKTKPMVVWRTKRRPHQKAWTPGGRPTWRGTTCVRNSHKSSVKHRSIVSSPHIWPGTEQSC